LFCPGIGIPLDTCDGLLSPSDPNTVGFVVLAFVDGKADAVDGTDGSPPDPDLAPDSTGTGALTAGVGGVVGVLSQALSHSTDAKSAITANGVRMRVSSC
jgi:hypothetical protein